VRHRDRDGKMTTANASEARGAAMIHILLKFAFVFILLGFAVPPGTFGQTDRAGEEDSSRHRHDDDAAMDHAFEDPEAWSQRWDTEERDAWQQPEKVVAFLGLDGGETVADIGAGTGYFTVRLAKAVGERGRVLAVDVAPEMLEFVAERARREGLPQVETVLAAPDDPKLPDGQVDLILTVNTWHHIDDRIAYLGTLRADLAPKGRLVIVDFREGELPVGPPAGHKIPRDELVAELKRGGFEPAGELDDLEYQYVLAFRVSGRR
jgi:SAM-dependent methyltransferase